MAWTPIIMLLQQTEDGFIQGEIANIYICLLNSPYLI